MQSLIRLALMAAQLIAVPQPAPPRVRPWCVAAGVSAVVVCWLAASGCLLTALWLFLLPLLGPAGTPLVIGCLLALKAASILLWLRYGLARPAPPAPSVIAPAVLLAEADRLFKANTGPVLMTALLVGLFAGGSER
jgi:hypothetical protein